MSIAASAPASASGGIMPAPPPAASGSGGAPAGNFDQVLSGTQAAAAPGGGDTSGGGPGSTPAAADASSSGGDERPAGHLAHHGHLRSGRAPLSSDSSDPSASRGKDARKAAPADDAGLAAVPLPAPVLPPADPVPDPAAVLAGAAGMIDPTAPAGEAADPSADSGSADDKGAGPPALPLPPVAPPAAEVSAATAAPTAPADAAAQAAASVPAPSAGLSDARLSKGRAARAEAKADVPGRRPGDASPPLPSSSAPAQAQAAAAPMAPFGAKIAAAGPDSAGPVFSAGKEPEKHPLETDKQKDTKASSPLGIGAAQVGSAMPPAASETAVLVRALSPEASVAPAASPSTANAAPATAAAQSAAASAPVRATVDTVVRLVEAQASRGLQTVSAVNLNFQVGADDLAVRVEWRNGEVHTQFRTDSEDLRSALASQWQSVSPGLADRSVHFAPPVFASSTSTSGQGFASAGGESASRQQGQPQQAGQGGAGRLASSGAARPAATSTPAAAPAPRAGRLQTFA